MIENPGVAPSECFTLLGCSTTRFSGNSETIGTFGSGSKHSISLLLRSFGISPIIFCSALRLEFGWEKQIVDDGLSKNTFHRVNVRMKGKNSEGTQINRVEDLGWVLEHGAEDWNDPSMAFREFVANAIDRSIREGKPNDVVITYVAENQVRAKTGFTRVFIQAIDSVISFMDTLFQRFLHFTGKATTFGILGKAKRNITSEAGAVIYKKGVRIREMADLPALFDYNFGDELSIDESRNAYSSDIKRLALHKILMGKPAAISIVVNALVEDKKVWEQTFNSYDFPGTSINIPEECIQSWQISWCKATNDKGVIAADTDEVNVVLKDRGYIPVKLNGCWKEVLTKLGIKTVKEVLSKDEHEGLSYFPYTPAVMSAFGLVWNCLLRLNIVNSETPEPEVLCFTKPKINNVELLGFARDKKIYISKRLSETLTAELVETMLEEVFHHVSGFTDFCRSFQDFYFSVMAAMLLEDSKKVC